MNKNIRLIFFIFLVSLVTIYLVNYPIIKTTKNSKNNDLSALVIINDNAIINADINSPLVSAVIPIINNSPYNLTKVDPQGSCSCFKGIENFDGIKPNSVGELVMNFNTEVYDAQMGGKTDVLLIFSPTARENFEVFTKKITFEVIYEKTNILISPIESNITINRQDNLECFSLHLPASGKGIYPKYEIYPKSENFKLNIVKSEDDADLFNVIFESEDYIIDEVMAYDIIFHVMLDDKEKKIRRRLRIHPN